MKNKPEVKCECPHSVEDMEQCKDLATHSADGLPMCRFHAKFYKNDFDKITKVK